MNTSDEPSTVHASAPSARKSRAGGIVMVLAGLAGVGAIWLPWLTPEFDDPADAEASGQAERLTVSLKEMSDRLGGGDGLSFFEDPTMRFYIALASGVVAVVVGLIGVLGSRTANIVTGTIGLLAAAGMAYAPSLQVYAVADKADLGAAMNTLGSGGYAAFGTALLVLVAAIVALVGAARARR